MKSSTLRRSTLSKETIAVLENLASSNQEFTTEVPFKPEDLLPRISIAEKENRSKEIDLLWQNFKSSQFNTKSPFAYVTFGFIMGVIVTLAVNAGISYYSSKNPTAKYQGIKIEKIKVFDNKKTDDEQTVQHSVNIPSENEEVVKTPEKPKTKVTKNAKTEETKNSETTVAQEKYFVKEGDTGESIIKRHYGRYSQEIEAKVKQANNLGSLDRIYIGQEIILP